MPSFILRNLDPEFWSRVQAKATAEGTTVKAVILRLLASWLGVLVLLSTVACGAESPTAPIIDLPKPGVPSRLELSANPGLGTDGGTGTITARVFDALSTALPNQTVTFTASDGTLGASQVVSDEKGYARTTIAGPAGPIQIVAAVGAVEMKTQIAIQSLPPGPPPPSIPPPVVRPPTQPTPPTPGPPAPGYTVTVGASPASVVVNNSATLTASVTALNGATAPTKYEWDCNADEKFEASTTVNFAACLYTVAGTIKSVVRVSSASATQTGSVDVVVAPAAPLAVAITASSSTLAVGASVIFTGFVTSTVPPPTTTTFHWEWDFGDGASAVVFIETGTNPLPRSFPGYGSVGVKTVHLKVTDPATGRTATGTRTVTVQ